MTLARVHSWIAGETLTAAALNAEFNNILSNGGGSLISPLTANLNVANNQLTNLVLEKLGTAPTPGTAGRIYYDTVGQVVKLDDGTGIHTVGPFTVSTSGSGAGSFVRGLAGAVSTNTAAFTAFGFTFQTTDGQGSFFRGQASADQSININFRTAGPIANGRDQAGVFTGDQLHLYAISSGAESTSIAGLCSTNDPFAQLGPVALPSSYVGWAYLASLVYNATSSMAAVSVQRVAGSKTYLVTTSNFAGAGQGNGAGVPILVHSTVDVETSAVVSAYVPVVAPSMMLANVGTGGRTSAAGTACHIESVIEADFSVPIQTINTRIDGVTSGRLEQDNTIVMVPNVNIPPSFVYYSIVTTGAGDPLLNINVLGYTNSNGDEA